MPLSIEKSLPYLFAGLGETPNPPAWLYAVAVVGCYWSENLHSLASPSGNRSSPINLGDCGHVGEGLVRFTVTCEGQGDSVPTGTTLAQDKDRHTQVDHPLKEYKRLGGFQHTGAGLGRETCLRHHVRAKETVSHQKQHRH